MTRRLAAIAVAGLIVSIALPGCRKRKLTNADDDIDVPKTLPRLFAENISEVAIDDGFVEVVLRRTDGSWRIVKPLSEPAGTKAIEAMLGELSILEWGTAPVAVGRAEWDGYFIADDQALKLSIVSEGERLPPIYLGNRGHARVGPHSDIYEIYRLNRYTFERELRLWRDLRIARIDVDAVTELAVTDRDRRTVGAKRDGDTWVLIGPAPVKGSFDPAVPAELLHRIATVKAYDIADGVDRASAGLDTPRLTITARAGTATTVIELGRDENELTYVGLAGSPRVWKVKTRGTATIDHGPDAWLGIVETPPSPN